MRQGLTVIFQNEEVLKFLVSKGNRNFNAVPIKDPATQAKRTINF